MPEILQQSEPVLYSEKNHKECEVILGESIFIENSKYNIHILITLPEIETNLVIPAVNVEIWNNEKIIGKAYKSLKKHQSFSSLFKRAIDEVGVVLGFYDDVQEVRFTVPAKLDPENNHSLKVKIFPPEVSVDLVKVVFEVRLEGFRYYLHEHFTLACLVGSSWIFILQVLLLSRLKSKTE
jgi:hypothetical protein